MGEYVETIWALAQQPGAILMVEQKCDFSHIVCIPDQFGTSDAVISIGDALQIHDLKYGYEKVDAFENPQLMLYALGALEQVSLIATSIGYGCLSTSPASTTSANTNAVYRIWRPSDGT